MKRIGIALSVIVCIPFIYFGLLVLVGGDVVTSHYNTYQEAKQDKLFKRGWLPEIIPKSAINIKTVNDLDLNISTGNFTIQKLDINEFESKLKKLNEKEYYYSDNKGYSRWVFIINHDNGYVDYDYE